ncbi:MAG: hypothetical protein ABIJ40_03440 [Bacteroidota bacterium]
MAKKKSDFGTIHWGDIFKSALYAFIAAVAMGLYTIVQALADTGQLTATWNDIYKVIGTGLGAFLLIILKQFLQNSDGKHLKKEQK